MSTCHRNANCPKLTWTEIRLRTLLLLSSKSHSRHHLFHPSEISYYVWPDRSFRAQGAGLIGANILKKLEREGLVKWHIERVADCSFYGYHLTAQGILAARSLPRPLLPL